MGLRGPSNQTSQPKREETPAKQAPPVRTAATEMTLGGDVALTNELSDVSLGSGLRSASVPPPPQTAVKSYDALEAQQPAVDLLKEFSLHPGVTTRFYKLAENWKNPNADKREKFAWSAVPTILEGRIFSVEESREPVDPDMVQRLKEMLKEKFTEELAFRTIRMVRPLGGDGAAMHWKTAEERGLAALLREEIPVTSLSPFAQAQVLEQARQWHGQTYLHAFIEAFGFEQVRKALDDFSINHPD